VAALERADELMEQSEPEQALRLYVMASSFADRDVAAAGFYGAGNALYRLDRESEARESWQRATSLGETPVTYRAWRQVAAALVREGDLPGALAAYRQCEHRAPREDRAEIASRLGWLSKETGNVGAAGRYFARSRGDAAAPFMTYFIIAITVVTSLAAYAGSQGVRSLLGGPLEQQLELNKFAIANGEYYRLLTVMLVHDPSNLLHLAFNMYALWFAGQLVERMYGAPLTLAMYVLSGLAASVGTYVFGDAAYSVGASGAIFGLFGVVLVATRLHHPILDAQSRAIASQVGVLIVLNLVIGFLGFLNVDNYAHVGGLIAGAWLGLLFPPGQVQTLASLWHSPRAGVSATQSTLIRIGGVVVLVAVIVAGIAAGNSRWQSTPGSPFGLAPSGAPAVAAAPPRAGPAVAEAAAAADPAAAVAAAIVAEAAPLPLEPMV
jgi:membrane associated rhomboid family serine protease